MIPQRDVEPQHAYTATVRGNCTGSVDEVPLLFDRKDDVRIWLFDSFSRSTTGLPTERLFYCLDGWKGIRGSMPLFLKLESFR